MSQNKVTSKKKKKYTPPQIKSEKLMTFGALCSGMAVGGRKSVSGPPDFCNATKLLS